MKLSGKDRIGICGKDPERNLDVSGSFRVTNSNNYLNINNNGEIDISGNIDLSGNINHLGNTDISGNIDISGDIQGNINELFTIKNNNNDQQFTINNIGNVGMEAVLLLKNLKLQMDHVLLLTLPILTQTHNQKLLLIIYYLNMILIQDILRKP